MANYMEEEQGGKGALAIVIIIIVLLLIGGIYAVNTQNTAQEATLASSTDPVPVQNENELPTSTSLDSIDQDLENMTASVYDTDLDELEKDIKGL